MKNRLLFLFGLFLVSCNAETNNGISSCGYIPSLTSEIKGGATLMESNSGYPEERTIKAIVRDFDIDTYEVTNFEFRKFIDATGYVTTAEKTQPGSNKPGGAVFKAPSSSNASWWQFVAGANWRTPKGPGSSIEGMDEHPVVQVSLVDAMAYAAWIGRALPTEIEWEYAARAGADTTYVWGEQRAPGGIEKANTWQGSFPIQNTNNDGFIGISPVGCFDPNGYDLYDMIGNVWEWTLTAYDQTLTPNSYTIKGGSYLCAENFCARYTAPARQAQEADFSTNHIGFRTVSAQKK